MSTKRTLHFSPCVAAWPVNGGSDQQTRSKPNSFDHQHTKHPYSCNCNCKYIYTLRDEERHPYLRENTPEQSTLWWRGGGVCLLTICPPGLTNCGRLRSAFSYRRHMRKTHYHNALKQIVAQQCVYVVYTLCSVYDATSQKKTSCTYVDVLWEDDWCIISHFTVRY